MILRTVLSVIALCCITATVYAQSDGCLSDLEPNGDAVPGACQNLEPGSACYTQDIVADNEPVIIDRDAHIPLDAGAQIVTRGAGEMRALQLDDMVLLLSGVTSLEKQSDDYEWTFTTGLNNLGCDEERGSLTLLVSENTMRDFTLNGVSFSLESAFIVFQFQSPNSLLATVMRGALHLSNGVIAQSGETIVAVTDNNGSIMFWSAPRPVDLAERQIADSIATVLNSSLNTSIVFGDICESLIHIVDAEENLFRIAIRYNTTVDSIQRSNNLHDTIIYPGQELTVPCNPAQIVGANPSCGDPVVHTVRTGENLYRIGLSYSVSVVAIKSANSLASDMIVVGDQLRIPCANGSVSSPTTAQSQTTSQFSLTIPQQAPCFNVAASFPVGDIPGVTSGFVTASC